MMKPAASTPGWGARLLALLWAASPIAAQKTDVVVMVNGDRITGEVKGLSSGKLDYSTDDAGRLSIEWDKVLRLTSRHSFEVSLRSGQRLYGTLVEPGQDGQLAVSGASANVVPIIEVVSMTPVGAGIWRRLKGSLDLGFTYAKANQNVQLSSSGELRYRAPEFGSTLNFSTYFQQQDNASAVTRNTVSAGAYWYFARRWSVGGISALEQNDQLGLSHRATLGAVAMRTLLENNRAEFRAPAGLIVTQERYYGSDSAIVSLEGLVGIDLTAFRFDTPKLDFSTAAYAYPSMTDWGRVRLQVDTKVKYEVIKDFFLGIQFTDSYDSRSPDTGASQNDFTTSFTIGWSFHQ
ncbi:MAG: DUF481 domain-containing protein [Gemmatimonadota bacterium]|nr:DUF481 domain-containing protein [Gemmatimonadota bacterium]